MENKNKETAYILWACGLVGLMGLHRFYMGKIGTGLLWFFTLGLFGIGWIVDGFTLGSQVELVNLKRQALLDKNNTPQIINNYHQPAPFYAQPQATKEPKEAPPATPEVNSPSKAQEIKSLTSRLRKIDKLFMNEFLTDEEYSKQKDALLRDMTMVVDESHPEDALMLFAQLKEEGVIDERDFKRVKGVLLS